MSNERIYFHNLDIIRFVAAFAVVLGHGFEAWTDYYVKFRHTPEFFNDLFSGNFLYVSQFFTNLGIGVEIFFFISGFLITYILLVEKEKFGKISIPKFFMRRSLRIWPLYFFLLALGPFLTHWMERGSPNYLSHIFFYSNFEIINSQTWSYPFAHFWSIALEEQFYFIWPFVIAFTPKKFLKFLFGAIILGSIYYRYWIFNTDPTSWNMYLNTLSRMDTIVIGGIIALTYHTKKFSFKVPKTILWIIGLVLIILLSIVPYAEWLTIWTSLFKKYIYLSLFGTLILAIILKPKPAKISKLNKVFTYLGKISFGIYMYHNILLLIVIKKILLNNTIESWTVFWIVYPACAILLSIISFELLEKRFLKLKERFAVVKTRKF